MGIYKRIVVIGGRGTLNSEMKCIVQDEGMGKFLRQNAKQPIVDIVSDEYKEDLVELWKRAIDGEAGEMFLDMLDGEENLVPVYVHIKPIQNSAKQSCTIELLEVHSAVRAYFAVNNEYQALASYVENQELCLFEYYYQKKTLEIYRYENGQKIAVSCEGYHRELKKLMRRISAVNGNLEKFRESVIINNKTYYVEGSVVFDGFDVYEIIGSIREKRERHCDSSSENISDAGSGDETGIINRGDMDSFTGLYNKTSALEYAKKLIEEGQKQVHLIMIDMDHFKSVNDTYGHIFGDKVIRRMAQIIKQAIRGRGIAARFGGDEFLIVAEDIGSEGDLRALLETIRTQIEWAFVDSEEEVVVTCSVGVSEFPKNGTDFDLLYKKADRGLYIAKQKGRNRYIIYKEAIHGEINVTDEIKLEQGINEALKTDVKMREVTRCILKLYREGIASLSDVMEQIIGIYGIDGISVYTGKNMNLKFSFGHYSNPIKDMSCILDPEVSALFNEYGVYHVNFNHMKKYLKEYHGLLEEHGIANTTQCLIGTREKINGLITFDREKVVDFDSRKWSDEEIHYLAMFTQILGLIVL